jgi:hypothetical protein
MKQCNAKAVHGDLGEKEIVYHCTRDAGHKGKHSSIFVKYGKKVKGKGTIMWQGKKEALYPLKLTPFWW